MSSDALHIQRLKTSLAEIPALREQRPNVRDAQFRTWHATVCQSLLALKLDRYNYRFVSLRFEGFSPRPIQRYQGVTGVSSEDAWNNAFAQAEVVLEQAIQDAEAQMTPGPEPPAAIKSVELIATRLHQVALQLTRRHDGRSTIKIDDEHDLQDLTHALLRLFFDDVREEEWTPSYAGGASRMDFLLKGERIVVECKMTRQNLLARELGSQLIDDIARYQSHPSCETLACIVYDPGGLVKNPAGVAADLEALPARIGVRVLIVP